MKFSISSIFYLSLLFLLIFSSSFLKAQTISDSLKDYSNYNQNKVYENHIEYQKTVWRRTSLLEKQNSSFFVKGNEVSKVIIDAVLVGKLQPYKNDSLRTEMQDYEFVENLTVPQEGGCVLFEEIILPLEGEWGNSSFFQDTEITEEEELEDYTQFQPNQIYILETKLDLFFDTRRNRMVNQIKSISFIIPAVINQSTGFDKTLASFSYQEIINYLFEENNFVWSNQRNSQANLNPKEAFDLMLLSGILVQHLAKDSYGHIYLYHHVDSEQELQKAHLYYNKLIEYESELWEN